MTNIVQQRDENRNEKQLSHDEDLNLSCILNTTDEVLEQPGRILIITSNHPSVIDKALLRPGRIDMTLSIINNIFNTNMKEIRMSREYSPAEIVNECFNASAPEDLNL